MVCSSVNPGFVQSGITLAKPAAGTYMFTIPAHPKEAIYMVFVQQQGTVSTGAIAIPARGGFKYEFEICKFTS